MKRMLIWIGILSLLSLGSTDVVPVAAKYTVLLGGNRAGTQVSQKTSEQEWEYQFEFNDRGRGPKISTYVLLGLGEIPMLIKVQGNDYLKAPVEEHFSIKSSKASWKSFSEKGEKSVTGNSFYITANSAPEEIALLARALLAAPEKKLLLLPDGEARIEKAVEVQVTANGKTKQIVLYSISGIAFTPTFVWLDQNQTYFASVSAWFSVIEEGWESVIPELIQKQDALIATKSLEMAKTLGHKPPAALVIENGNVFDSETGKILPEATVVISEGRIQSVGPKVKMPADTEVIDATGKTVLPGLWDMHVHLSEVDGPLNIAAGVTSVRDLANDTDFILKLRGQFDKGEAIGPRVILAGILDGSGPYAGPTKVLVDTEEQVRAAIDNYAKLGYVQIKIYSSIKPELVPVITSEAHKHGMRVSGHIPAYMTAEQCVKLGYDEIQHANFLILNFFPDVKDTRTPLRFTAVAENAAGLDLKSEQVQSFIQLLKEHHTVLDPTLNAFESLFTDRPGTMSATVAAIADRLPPQVRRGYLAGGLPVPAGKDELYRQSFQATKNFINLLYHSGIQIVAGTDALAGFTLHRELELYVDAGIPSADVLQLATLGAARVMKRDQELGSIQRGKLADLIIIDGDPVASISNIRKVSTILKDGVVYQSSDIYKAIGIKP